MKTNQSIIDRLIKQSWFFSAFLFLGLIISGNVDSKNDFFATLTLCLVFWLLDSLFLKKGTTILLSKVLNNYKRFVRRFDKEK